MDHVREAIEEAGGIIPDAAELLFQKVIMDQVFLYSHLPQMVKAWCAVQVGTRVGHQRLAAWNPPAPPQHGARLSAAITTVALMDFPLPKGKLLRDASRSEVIEARDHYAGKASDAAWKARWLERIATSLGNHATVGAALSEAQLVSLKEISENA